MVKILSDVILCVLLDPENKILFVKLNRSISSQIERIVTIFYFPDFLVYIPLLSNNLIEIHAVLICSNYDIFLTRDCLAYSKVKPVVNQFESHPYFQRDSLVKFCRKHGICATAHTPLGGSVANTELFGSDSCLDEPILKVSSLFIHFLRVFIWLNLVSSAYLVYFVCSVKLQIYLEIDDTLKLYILFYDEDKLNHIGEFIKYK